MPSYGRWRHIKIVVSQNNPSRAQEISGGIKNALNRGENLTKAKQSFINAGYTPQEVQAATRRIRSKPLQETKPLNPSQPQSAQSQQVQTQTTFSKKTIIILSVIGAAILITALVLGLFWDKIF